MKGKSLVAASHKPLRHPSKLSRFPRTKSVPFVCFLPRSSLQQSGPRPWQGCPARRGPRPAWWSSAAPRCTWPTWATQEWCWGSRTTPRMTLWELWRWHRTTSQSFPRRGRGLKALGAGRFVCFSLSCLWEGTQGAESFFCSLNFSYSLLGNKLQGSIVTRLCFLLVVDGISRILISHSWGVVTVLNVHQQLLASRDANFFGLFSFKFWGTCRLGKLPFHIGKMIWGLEYPVCHSTLICQAFCIVPEMTMAAVESAPQSFCFREHEKNPGFETKPCLCLFEPHNLAPVFPGAILSLAGVGTSELGWGCVPWEGEQAGLCQVAQMFGDNPQGWDLGALPPPGATPDGWARFPPRSRDHWRFSCWHHSAGNPVSPLTFSYLCLWQVGVDQGLFCRRFLL